MQVVIGFGNHFHLPHVPARLEVTHCDIWYIRFCLDYEQSLLVLGNQVGKVFVWDMMVEDPAKLK